MNSDRLRLALNEKTDVLRSLAQPCPPSQIFFFKGISEYLDDFVARIDAPMLGDLRITFFHHFIFETPNLPQFISRTPSLKAHNEACVDISDSGIRLEPVQIFARVLKVKLEVPYDEPDWPSPFAQVCRSSFPHAFISSLENLHIHEDERLNQREVDTRNARWLELLHLFTAVKNLYLSEESTPRFARVLQEIVGERVVEILPALQGLFLDEVIPVGPVQEAIGQFVAARQLSSQPIAVSYWDEEDGWQRVDD